MWQGLNGDLKGVRIGVIKELLTGLSDEVARSFNEALRQLRILGAEVDEVDIPHIEMSSTIATNIMFAEAAEYHEQWMRTRAHDYGADVRRMLEAGMMTPGIYYVRAQRSRAAILAEKLKALDHFTVLAAPTAAIPAPRIDVGGRALSDSGQQIDMVAAVLRFTAPFNVTGQPALAIPTGLAPNGLPLSMQIIGRPFDEATVFQSRRRIRARSRTARRAQAVAAADRDTPTRVPAIMTDSDGSRRPSDESGQSLSVPACLGVGAAILALAAAVELAMGRKIWGISGQPGIWSGDVNSPHNSQYLTDPYSFSHLTHGILLYGLTWLLARRSPVRNARSSRLLLEAGWEMIENSSMVIERYRTATISLHYYGDSVMNSMCDILTCMVGFMIAAILPTRVTIVAAFVLEIGLALWIRDGLLLNIVMLIHPFPAIRAWQSAN